MKPNHIITGCAFALALAGFASADTLELRDGRVLTGKFAGGEPGMIKLETPEGARLVDTSLAVSLTFTPPPPPPAAAAPSVVAAAQPQFVQVPAGTLLLVRLDAPISSSSSAAGQRFSCRLETDVVANGVVVARSGTPVYGRVTKAEKARRLAGKSELELQLSEINLGGQAVPLATSNYAEAGQGEFRNTARNAALGAGVGAAFGGGEGAAKGAAIGGAASALKKGEAVTLNAGSLLEFRLTAGFSASLR